MNKKKDKPVSIYTHLSELRQRLIFVTLSWFTSFAICLLFSSKIISILMKPLDGQKNLSSLSCLNVYEGFNVFISAIWLFSFVCCIPIVAYQVFAFCSKAMTRKEGSIFMIMTLLGFALFAIGALFSFLVIVPSSLNFFSGYSSVFVSSVKVNFSPSISSYFSLLFVSCIASGLVFQVPLVISGLIGSGLVRSSFFKLKRRHTFVLMFILGAIVTPPDVITQAIIAIPSYIMYELAIVIGEFVKKYLNK